MAFTDKVFGLILVLAGLFIGVYWTVWQVLSLPVLSRTHWLYDFFPEPYYLFKLPALALVVGLLLIDAFISSTNRKIAAEKAAKEAKAKKSS